MLKRSLPRIPRLGADHLTVLAYRLALAYVFFFIARLAFYLGNIDHFRHLNLPALITAFTGGLRFDTAALVYLNLPFLLLSLAPLKLRCRSGWHTATDIAFLLPNISGLLAGIADTVYYPFVLKRSTTLVFSEFSHEGAGLILRLVWHYRLWTAVAIALSLLMIFLYRRLRPVKTAFENQPGRIYYPLHTGILLIAGIFCIGGMRGGFSHSTRPITLSNAAACVQRPDDRALVLNTPFCLLRTIGKAALPELHYFANDEDARKIFSCLRRYSDSTPRFGELQGRNVMILIVESFAREFVGSLNEDIPGYRGYTPEFDSLTRQGFVFKEAFANGRKSIDAMPSILASIPALCQNFILSHYSGNTIGGLASLLAREGYSSQFFHGAPNGSMGFDAFARQCGYQKYFGKNEYGNTKDFDGSWGIWDEPFLQRVVKELGTMPEPFLGTAFTLSSHDPFRVPKTYEGRFPQGKVPLIQCIGYTDYAVGRFFRAACKEPWFNRTLFVIVADHASQSALPRYQTPAGRFAVPLLFYAPGAPDFAGKDLSTVVQQTDILPTILALLGYRDPFIAFGSNVFDASVPHFAVNTIDDALQLIRGDFTLESNGSSPRGFFNYRTDPEQRHDLSKAFPDSLDSNERLLQSVLWQYNHRMRTNRLTVTPVQNND